MTRSALALSIACAVLVGCWHDPIDHSWPPPPTLPHPERARGVTPHTDDVAAVLRTWQGGKCILHVYPPSDASRGCMFSAAHADDRGVVSFSGAEVWKVPCGAAIDVCATPVRCDCPRGALTPAPWHGAAPSIQQGTPSEPFGDPLEPPTCRARSAPASTDVERHVCTLAIDEDHEGVAAHRTFELACEDAHREVCGRSVVCVCRPRPGL